jgi:hypothetical protein
MSHHPKHSPFAAVNLYFGEQHLDTLQEFDELSRTLKRSRTGTLHFLMTHYKWYNKHKLTCVG